VGERAGAHTDEVVSSNLSCYLCWWYSNNVNLAQVQAAIDKAKNEGRRVAEYAKEDIDKADQIRHETAQKMGTTVDKLDRAAEQKASEAKKGISGWFGGGK
jgi:uncharacterized Fe-S cluster-containing radical SAM superfamily protein